MNILVTGASGGIAHSISNNLKHHNLYLPVRKEFDVTNLDNIRSYLDGIDDLDVLINTAGTLYDSSVKDSNPDMWLRDINVNFIGIYLVTQEVLKRFKEQRE